MYNKSFKQMFAEMKENDVISELLYCIYKGTSDPDQALLSRLVYTLNKDDIYHLCEYFGGCTLTIPTISRLKVFVSALTLYYLQNASGLSLKESLNQIPAEFVEDALQLYPTVERSINEFKGIK